MRARALNQPRNPRTGSEPPATGSVQQSWTSPTRILALAALVIVPVLSTVPACFKPDRPACAFSCADPSRSCPPGFVCGDDNICHDPLSPGVCDLDAGADSN